MSLNEYRVTTRPAQRVIKFPRRVLIQLHRGGPVVVMLARSWCTSFKPITIFHNAFLSPNPYYRDYIRDRVTPRRSHRIRMTRNSSDAVNELYSISLRRDIARHALMNLLSGIYTHRFINSRDFQRSRTCRSPMDLIHTAAARRKIISSLSPCRRIELLFLVNLLRFFSKSCVLISRAIT